MEENSNNLNPSQPVPPVEQTPPISNSEKRKSKLPILIIGIILFLLIVGSAAGFYVFKQQSSNTTAKPTPTPLLAEVSTKAGTPNPASNAASATANWKTFVEPDAKYTIKYPSDWSVYTRGNLKQDTITSTELTTKGMKSGTFAIGVVKIRKNIFLAKEWVKRFSNSQTKSDVKTINFNDIDAYEEKIEGVINIVFDKNDLLYSISLNTGIYENYYDQKIIDQILSTFRFE